MSHVIRRLSLIAKPDERHKVIGRVPRLNPFLKRGGKITMTWLVRKAAKTTARSLLLASAGALALFTQTGARSLWAQSVPGTWKVIPGITTNAVFLPVGQDIAVVSANDIWQVGYA